MPDLLSEITNHVLIITLNRPDRLNALSPDMREGLIGLLQEQADNLSCRAVLIRGNGRGFCTGADVQPDQILKRREHIGEEVENDELLDNATALAEKLAAGPTKALGLIKREIAQAQTQNLDTTLTFEARCQQTAFNTDDFAEGIGAHHQKRKPAFSGQ